VRTNAEGVSNLPSTATSAGALPASDMRLPIGELAVHDLTAQWRSETRCHTVEVDPTTITLTGDRSRISGAIVLNILVAMVEDIVINNNYADATLGADLRIVGTFGAPALSGRASLGEGGQLRLGNRVYEIETGNVAFLGVTGLEPTLDIAARTRVSSHEITVTISGQPDTFTTSFQSEPPESESDIVSLLLTGRTLDQAGSAPWRGRTRPSAGFGIG